MVQGLGMFLGTFFSACRELESTARTGACARKHQKPQKSPKQQVGNFTTSTLQKFFIRLELRV